MRAVCQSKVVSGGMSHLWRLETARGRTSAGLCRPRPPPPCGPMPRQRSPASAARAALGRVAAQHLMLRGRPDACSQAGPAYRAAFPRRRRPARRAAHFCGGGTLLAPQLSPPRTQGRRAHRPRLRSQPPPRARAARGGAPPPPIIPGAPNPSIRLCTGITPATRARTRVPAPSPRRGWGSAPPARLAGRIGARRRPI
ncbi:MAG: hypothetical protein J3K34DRAFT_414023 [Monoraphidium minutum]|nr:MAG: hypothetical protein J3K34DRAFT_414023 [Monoraphidium minutum]